MKRIAAVLVGLVLLAGLTGCASTDDGPRYINCAWFVSDDGYLAPFFCDEVPNPNDPAAVRQWCIDKGSSFFAWMDPDGNQQYVCTRTAADIAKIKAQVYEDWTEH